MIFHLRPMTRMSPLLSFHLIFTLLFSFSIAAPRITSQKGFSFHLLHSDSIYNSNLYANLTTTQRLLRYVQSYPIHFHSQKYNTTVIRPHLVPQQLLFTAELNIGTGSGTRTLYLHLDTGSDLTWTQCVPCNPCIPYSQPMYDSKLSPSYRPLAASNHLCVPPILFPRWQFCFYNVRYGDGSAVSGIVASETFSFKSASSGQQLEAIPDLVFGCSHSVQMKTSDVSDGILGMGNSPLSLAFQLASVTNGRFSYCFAPPATAHGGFLRFGNDIVIRGPVQHTPFMPYSGAKNYYVLLNGVTMNNRRLIIQPHALSGVIIDSGTTLTHLKEEIFTQVKNFLVGYFFQFNFLHRIDGSKFGLRLELCYGLPNYFDKYLPSMELNLQGADLTIHGRELFFVDQARRFFCLAIFKGSVNVLGAYQQYNTRFIYDVVNKQISFAPEDCARDE